MEGNANPVRGTMGLNWLWYAPLAAWVFVSYGIYGVISAYHNVKTILYFPHSWAVLFSPSMYLFGFATLLNIWTPNALLLLIVGYFSSFSD